MPKKKGIVDHYATLEIKEDADEVDVKKAYRSLVLKWHPDKHREDRDAAEERIRVINAAYEVLSNPTKKETYDLQRGAMEGGQPLKKKARVSPRVSIPKEFMVQPIGHPDKFLRCQGEEVTVEGRHKSSLEFEEFFLGAKFSLWWLPEVNNCCRIRALGSKSQWDKRSVAGGVAGGLNLAFKFSKQSNVEAPLSLAEARKGQKNEAVNFIVTESSVYEGAFRFEAASRKGCFLAFTAPNRPGVIALNKDKDQNAVLDFMLVDFSVMSNFIDMEEVLIPAMRECGGDWVAISALQDNPKVKAYFEAVIKKAMWGVDDFVSYFNGHWTIWEYRGEDQCVRLRPSSEMLGEAIAAASTADEVVSIIAGIGKELNGLTLMQLTRAMWLIWQVGMKDGSADKEVVSKFSGALERLATALQAMVDRSMLTNPMDLSPRQLIGVMAAFRTVEKKLPSTKSSPRARLEVLPFLAELALSHGDIVADDVSGAPAELLLPLLLAAPKLHEPSKRGQKLGLIAGVVASKLPSWSTAEIIQLLLAAAKTKKEMPPKARQALLEQATEPLRPQLKEFASADLLKLVLAVSGEEASPSDLLVISSKEVLKRLSDFPQAQLLLLTQALTQGLGNSHEVVHQLLDFWTEVLNELDGPKGQTLSADQLVKLGQVASLVLSGSADSSKFFESLSGKIFAQRQKLSESGRGQLQDQLDSSEGLGVCSRKYELLSALLEQPTDKVTGQRARSRSRTRK